MSIGKYPEDRFWKNLMIPSADSLIISTVVTAVWELTIANKSRINASFFRADVRNWCRIENL